MAWPEKSDFSGLRWMTASRLATSPPKDPDDLAAEECLGRHRRSADAADSRFSIFLRWPKRGGVESIVRKFHDFVQPSEIWISRQVFPVVTESGPSVSGQKAMDCGFLRADPEEVFHQAGHAPGRSLVVKRLGKE